MDYIRTETDGQLALTQTTECLHFPSGLHGFHNTATTKKRAESGRNVFCFHGLLDIPEEERTCRCGARMHINGHPTITLRHLCIGGNLSCLMFPHNQLKCPACGATKTQSIPFKALGYRITEELYQYTRDLLAFGTYTNKQVAEITGLGKNTVKAIDKQRLLEFYTIGGVKLIKPEKTTKYLGIDEFKLHDGKVFATHIIDMETGHILWIAKGKKKQVVYDFIDHVGLEWMASVVAVACDMNSDFYEAFQERCPHLKIVFDHFHIVKNFNDKVISEIRKDEQKRLADEGDEEAAKSLKKSKYILMSQRSTLQRKDKEAEKGKVIHKGSALFGTEDIVRQGGHEERYNALLQENTLLFTVDLIKEMLSDAYKSSDALAMAEKILDIMDLCESSSNKHLLWFRRLLDTHFEGIIAHATYQISNGKIEGVNQRIKTLRRHGYGYPDDEYFFLKLIDASHTEYVRNPKSHKICD